MKTKMTTTYSGKKPLPQTAIALALSLLALCLAIPGAAFQTPAGQDNGPGGGQQMGMHGGHHMRMHGPKRHLAFLTHQLNLTQDQQNKIKPILENQHKQMRALRDDTSLSREQKRAKFMELRKNTIQQIQSNLTPDQVTKFQQMRERHEQRMKAWREKHGAGNTTGSAPPAQ